MASKTRALLLAVVLLTAGLAGCADTDETDTDDRDTTGERDTGDRDMEDRDTQERDTQTDRVMFNRSFNDTIDEQNYVRNWTVPANESNANVTIEANISGDAVDDFEATLFTPEGDEICTVSASGDTGLGVDDDEDRCEEQLEDTGSHRLTVWGNSTAGEAEYWLNVTVERPQQADDDTQTGGDGGGIAGGDTSNGGPYEGSIARLLGT